MARWRGSLAYSAHYHLTSRIQPDETCGKLHRPDDTQVTTEPCATALIIAT